MGDRFFMSIGSAIRTEANDESMRRFNNVQAGRVVLEMKRREAMAMAATR